MGIKGARLNAAREIRAGKQLADQDVAELVATPPISVSLAGLPSIDEIESQLVEQTRDMEDMVWVYLTMLDEAVRPEHAALHGTQWELDDPNLPVPPLGPGCRCRVELRARNRAAERRTGMPRAEKRPPEPGGEAVKEFLDQATNRTTGKDVTAVDIYGKQKGALVESGKVDPDALIGPDGQVITAAEAKGVAEAGGNARAARRVLSASAQLQGLGITVAQAQRFVTQAREAGGPLLSALTDVIAKARPGFIGARTETATKNRAKQAAQRIMLVLGL